MPNPNFNLNPNLNPNPNPNPNPNLKPNPKTQPNFKHNPTLEGMSTRTAWTTALSSQPVSLAEYFEDVGSIRDSTTHSFLPRRQNNEEQNKQEVAKANLSILLLLSKQLDFEDGGDYYSNSNMIDSTTAFTCTGTPSLLSASLDQRTLGALNDVWEQLTQGLNTPNLS